MGAVEGAEKQHGIGTKVEEVAMAVRIAFNRTAGEAELKARELVQPGEPNFVECRNTCILMWSFEDRSLWMGPKRQ